MAILPYSIRGDGYDFDKMNVGQQGLSDKDPDGLIEPSEDNQTVDYTELIKENAFLGEYTYESIIEGIEEQLSDYMHLEDDNRNYVDIFYNQLHASYEAAMDDEEEHPQEKKEVLDSIHDKFVERVAELFKLRLTLTFIDIEDPHGDNDIEFALKKSYEFFILNATKNFMKVICTNIHQQIESIVDDKEYYSKIDELLIGYSPIITSIGPMEFLKCIGDEEIIDLFESGKIIGNFLRKYSPKLYNNESFKIDIITNITTYVQFIEDLQN